MKSFHNTLLSEKTKSKKSVTVYIFFVFTCAYICTEIL